MHVITRIFFNKPWENSRNPRAWHKTIYDVTGHVIKALRLRALATAEGNIYRLLTRGYEWKYSRVLFFSFAGGMICTIWLPDTL